MWVNAPLLLTAALSVAAGPARPTPVLDAYGGMDDLADGAAGVGGGAGIRVSPFLSFGIQGYVAPWPLLHALRLGPVEPDGGVPTCERDGPPGWVRGGFRLTSPGWGVVAGRFDLSAGVGSRARAAGDPVVDDECIVPSPWLRADGDLTFPAGRGVRIGLVARLDLLPVPVHRIAYLGEGAVEEWDSVVVEGIEGLGGLAVAWTFPGGGTLGVRLLVGWANPEGTPAVEAAMTAGFDPGRDPKRP